jgi:hypothetical protein
VPDVDLIKALGSEKRWVFRKRDEDRIAQAKEALAGDW